MVWLLDNQWAIPLVLLAFAWLSVTFADIMSERWKWSTVRRRVLTLLLIPVIPCFIVAPTYALWQTVTAFDGTCRSLFDSDNPGVCTRFEAFMVRFMEYSILGIPVSVGIFVFVLGIWFWRAARGVENP